MKQFIAVILIMLGTQPCFSQARNSERTGLRISVEAGFSIPAKESFRTNYDQSLFVGSAHVPLSIGLAAAYPLSSSTDLVVSFERRGYILSSSDDIRMAVMPVLVGLEYHFSNEQVHLGRFLPHCGLMAGWYSAVFSAKFIQTTQFGPDPIGIIDDSQRYSGYGVRIGIGIDDPLSEVVVVGAEVRYDITSLGAIDDGGLGNLGGFMFALKFTYAF